VLARGVDLLLYRGRWWATLGKNRKERRDQRGAKPQAIRQMAKEKALFFEKGEGLAKERKFEFRGEWVQAGKREKENDTLSWIG